MFYTYLIKSKIKKWIYVDSSGDLIKRFKKHNQKKIKSTKAYAPFEMIYYEAYESSLWQDHSVSPILRFITHILSTNFPFAEATGHHPRHFIQRSFNEVGSSLRLKTTGFSDIG